MKELMYQAHWKLASHRSQQETLLGMCPIWEEKFTWRLMMWVNNCQAPKPDRRTKSQL